MKNKFLFTTISIACFSVFYPSISLADSKLTPTSMVIPKYLVDKAIASTGQPDSTELRQQITEALVNERLIVNDGHRLGIPKSKDFKEKIENVKKSVLIAEVVDHYLSSNEFKPTEAEISAEYDKVKTASVGAKEYHIRHILLDKETDVTPTVTKLKNGSKFSELAKSLSKDEKTAADGGNLGWINPEGINVPEFAKAISSLKKSGDYTDTAVKTPLGWHLLWLEELRDVVVPPLNQIKNILEQRIKTNPTWREAKVQAIVKMLRSKSKIH